uniref:Uncharacterized protein n=1 Tax=Myotis myotis TaxID=51298 RepID=A0A7J7V3Q4_MYOMY|nr:hypothetical protein mMyoMyo1_008506 [Myotis myotis]
MKSPSPPSLCTDSSARWKLMFDIYTAQNHKSDTVGAGSAELRRQDPDPPWHDYHTEAAGRSTPCRVYLPSLVRTEHIPMLRASSFTYKYCLYCSQVSHQSVMIMDFISFDSSFNSRTNHHR